MGKLIDSIKKEKKERAEQEKKQKAASLTPQLPSYFNVLAKNNDKYGLSAAREEKSFDVQPTRKLGLIEQIKREKTSANADSIIDRLNTWYKNSNNFMSNYQTRFSGLTGTYNDPYDSGISDWLSTVTEQKSRFDAEADSILSYLTANSDLFDEEWLNATITNLNFTRKQQEDILKNTENINKHWSQFADENEYLGYQNEYQKQKRYEGYQSKYEGKSYEDIVSALGTMQDGEEKDWLKNESLMRYDLDAGQEEIGRLTSILDVKNQITAIKQEESTLKLAIAKGDKNAAEKLAKNNQRLEALNSTWEHALSTYGSEDNLNSLLSSKRAEYTTAERAQKAAELALVADETSEVYDPKFSTYSELGKHISYENVGSTKNQNGIAIYDDLKAATLALNEHQLGTELYTEDMMLPGDGISGYLQGLKGISEYNSENNDTVKTFRKMNESEFAILAYYLKKDEENGTDLAAQYIASIKQTLNTRVAMDIAKEKEGNLALQYVFAVEAGLDQFYEGRDAWRSGEDSIVPSATQIASGIIREDLAETGAKLPDWLGGASLGQVGYDAITTTSNMLPSILVSTVGNAALPGVGTIAGAGVLGMSAGGNAKAEMLRLGYSEDQATSYGLMVGIAEAGMEYLLGHIPGLSKGDGLFSTLGTKVASKVDNAISRVAISLGDKGTDILKAAASRAIGAVGGALDEALEEGLQTIIEPWLKEVATSVDWEDPKVDEVLYSSLLGAITSFGFSAGETVIDGVRYPAVQNAEAKKNLGAYQGEIASEVVALNPNDSFAKNMQAKVESGKDLSGSQLNRLVKNYESTLTQNDVEKIKSATVNRLNELGESGDVEVIASALTKQATGKKLSSKEQKVIESSTFGQRVANELNPENIKSRGYTSAWAENIGTDRINVKEYNKDLMESEDAPTRVTVGGKTAAAVVLKNAEGKTVRAEIQGVEADGDKATFKLSNGETVASDKVAFKSEDAKLVADTATERVSRVEGFTNETATAMIKGYDGSVSAAKYITLFDEAYNMGATDKPSSALVKVMNLGISESVAHTAYVLGKESSKNAESILNSEAKNGIINNNINESEAGYESGENLHLRNSGERVGSQNTQGQVPRMESGAGQAESRGKAARIADSEAARLVNEGREVKVADLGILGGSAEQTVRLVDKANETSLMKDARASAEARGLKVKFFVGDNLIIKDSGGKWISARAYVKGEHVFIRADHPLYTADQLMRHELGHDMIAKGEVDIAAVRERLIETVGKENIDEVANLYADAYEGTGMSAEEIWEECICDSLGDMNIFAGKDVVKELLVEGILPEIKAAASETKSPTQTRGSPEGKASRERHDLYTATKAFVREVAPGQRGAFARSLANKTSDMAEGEIRTIYVAGYIFEADGYMHGHMLAPYNEKTKNLLEVKESGYDEIDKDRESASVWTEAVQYAEQGSSRNSYISRRGRSGADDRLLGTSSERDSSGNNERVREAFETKEEAERILSQLKKLYGLEEADEASKYSSPEEAKASGKTSRELDTEYLSAVNRGDMETAQRMVDEAAKKAGYTIKAYHGSNAEFTVFDKNRVGKGNDQYGAGFYFASNADVTDLYGKKRYDTYLNIKKPIRLISKPGDHGNPLYNARITQTQAYQILKRHPLMYDPENSPLGDFYEEYWSGGAKEWMVKDLAKKYDTIGALDGDVVLYRDYPNELHEAIRDVTGYDGVVVYFETEKMVDERNDYYYVAWFDNQMKSADPVVRDGNGDVIPLTERFDPENNDIRYSRELDFLDFMEQQTDREVLANAFESVAQNDVEKAKLKDYRENINRLNTEEEKLMRLRAEIKELSFAKGARDITKIAELRQEAEKTSNRIGIYDKRLLTLEASKPLRAVLEREKQKSYNRAKAEARADLDAYRARAQKSQEELKARYQESKQRGVEGRRRTELRHKIRGTMGELNNLLLHGSKNRNVKLGLQEAVAAALGAINMDTVAADERVAKYNDLIAKATDPYIIESLTQTRDRIQKQGDVLGDKLEAMRKAYENIIESKDENNPYPDYYKAEAALIEKRVKSVIDKVGDTPIRYMTLEQLQEVYDLYKMVFTTVRNANTVFMNGKTEDLVQNVNAFMEDLSKIPKLPEERLKMLDKARALEWNEYIPYYAFTRIGSKNFEKFYWAAIDGQDVYAKDTDEAKTFATETRKKYHYDKWDLNKVHEFKLADGQVFKVTLKHMMSIYAYSKREQAAEHMRTGGFFFNDKATFRKNKGVLEMIRSSETGYKIDDNSLIAIVKALSEEQRKYVDEMQAYLTQMGEKGNEVTRVLWGINLFKEKVYFPLKSSTDFVYQANQPVQESSLKNDGMTKETKPGASNPIILEAFDDVWSTHVERMSQYHAYVLPIENLNKILNYGTWANTDAVAVTTMLRARFGSAAVDYFNRFIGDLNGVKGSKGAAIAFLGNMFTKFKKTAVAASFSVIVQQPTAILRAQAVIDPKYFVGQKVSDGKLKETWEEIKKHAPIAIIKEMGGYDAGVGRQAIDWMNADTKRGIDKVSSKADDLTMMGAAWGDMLGWCTIWNAVKRETISKHHDLAPTSDEFFDIVHQRFNEVIVKTQVYDSTLSRSGYMRSDKELTKMATAFKGEPTLSTNILYDSVIQAKRGTITKGTAVRRIGSVYLATVAAAIAKSAIYALGDDDEDESYAEKYLQALGGTLNPLTGDIDPLTWLPGISDIISIFDGWDVERTDMAIFKDLKDAIDGLDSDSKSTWRKLEDFAGAVAAFFGQPLKNVMKSMRQIYNACENMFDGITGGKLGAAFLEGATGKGTDKSQSLYDAILAGDEARLAVYRDDYDDDFQSAIRKALHENDVRIKEAAKAFDNVDSATYEATIREIVGEGVFTQDDVLAAISSASRAFNTSISNAASLKLKGEEKKYEKMLKEIIKTYKGVYTREEIEAAVEIEMSKPQASTTESDKIKSKYSIEYFYKAVRNNKIADAYIAREDIIGAAVDNGKSQKAAEQAFESSITTFVGDKYKSGLISDADATRILTEFGGKTEAEASSKIRYWAFVAENPEYNDFTESAVTKYYEGSYKDGELYGKSAQSYGISLEIYAEYIRGKAGLDLKEDIMYIINTLPLTKEQKDALYYLNTNWSKNEIRKAPWR